MDNSNRNDKKQKEADAQFKKGKKALSTGLLKWNPDHLGASLHFESAAKLFKELGDEEKAKDSYIQYAVASEHTDSQSCAADGYTQAAFLEKNFVEAEKLLKKSQMLYQIDGKSERGLKNLKDYVKKELEQFEDADYQDPQKLQRIQVLYESIFLQLFEHPDNMLFNVDLVDDYMNMLMQYEKFHEAIKAKQKFIQYLISAKEIDHQIKRSYLEVFLLYMLLDEKYKLKGVVEEFEKNYPNAFKQDEYNLASQLLDVLAPQNGANTDQNWVSVKQILKKPIFSFLNNDIVKRIRILTDTRIEENETRFNVQNQQDELQDDQIRQNEGKTEEENLNDQIL